MTNVLPWETCTHFSYLIQGIFQKKKLIWSNLVQASWGLVFVCCFGARLDQQSEGIPVQELTWGNQSRDLENMKAQFVAVNGIRKVACVVRTIFMHDMF